MTFEGAIRKGGDWKVVVVALSRECPEPSKRERANNSGGAIEGRKKEVDGKAIKPRPELY